MEKRANSPAMGRPCCQTNCGNIKRGELMRKELFLDGNYLKYFPFLVFIILSLITFLFSQENVSTKENLELKESLSSTVSFPKEKFPTFNEKFLSVSVDENEYYVDSGDIFLIKIDVKGPSVKIFQSTVTPDGYVMLPDVPSIKAKNLLLSEAKDKIKSALQKNSEEAKVEVFLFQVHPIMVTVLGSVKSPGTQQLQSSSRLFDALKNANKETQGENLEKESEEESKKKAVYGMSVRDIRVIRAGEVHYYDLFKFNYLGDTKENPYLMNGDIILVSQRKKLQYSIQVLGAVKEELKFAYKPGETVEQAISYAGGLSPVADSNRIELYRFDKDKISINKQTFSYDEIKNIYLMPDDRIIVRSIPNYHPKAIVEIKGEVVYPGFYPIEDGITTLTELIRKAGGFTHKAYLPSAKVIRKKYLLEDKELDRLRRMTVEDMTDIEESYYKLRSRENLRIVTVDFEKLFKEGKSSEDIHLRDKDEITIPETKKIVFISGGILYPGNVTYKQNYTYIDYIKIAGGFNKRAKKKNIKIIKNKTGNWVDADKSVIIEEGDIIFVPEKKEHDWWKIIKEGLTVTVQVGTLVVLFLVRR
ncbi:MAG: SLBB domain-containing protein [Promethearchaeota archaeon]